MCRRRATVQWRHLVNWREAARLQTVSSMSPKQLRLKQRKKLKERNPISLYLSSLSLYPPKLRRTVETQGLLKVTGSHVHCQQKYYIVQMQNRDIACVVTTLTTL